MGVLILSLEVIRSYLKRGIPKVKFTPPWPAKWKVFRVIWVEGYPIDWAAVHPTAYPGSTIPLLYLSAKTYENSFPKFIFSTLSKDFYEILPKLLAGLNFSWIVAFLSSSPIIWFTLNFLISSVFSIFLNWFTLNLAPKAPLEFEDKKSKEIGKIKQSIQENLGGLSTLTSSQDGGSAVKELNKTSPLTSSANSMSRGNRLLLKV